MDSLYKLFFLRSARWNFSPAVPIHKPRAQLHLPLRLDPRSPPKAGRDIGANQYDTEVY